MDIICNECQSKFRIPDHKIPESKSAFLQCPKCNNKISVVSKPPIDETLPDLTNLEIDNNSQDNQNMSYSDDVEGKPFDFIEEEGKSALICEHDPVVRKKITTAIDLMEYSITVVETAREALIQLRNRTFDLVLINENFDTDNPDSNGVLVYLERLDMSIRRNIFVALISNRFRTMDNMIAFNKSVNLVIHINHINDIIKILPKAITENEIFFEVYKNTLKEMRRL
jgi:predicted Zn finger-like uncharacterized protein